MNMDVTVRLRDDAAGATRVLKHFRKLNEATRQLGGSGTERNLRGLAKSVASLDRATTETGASRLTRVAGAVRGLSQDAGRIDSAARAVGMLSRSLAKLSTTAEAAEKATSGLTMMREALAHMPASGGFVSETNRELRETLNLQRRALAGMRALNAGGGGGGEPRGPGNGGGGGGRRGRGRHGSFDSMMGHAFFGATSGITLGGEAIREVYRQGADRVDEFVKMTMAGIDAEQITRNRAAAVATARIVGGSGINQNLATIRHLRFALGSDEEATRALTPVAQATATMRAMNPGMDAEANAFAMAKAAEMKGVSQDPKKFKSYMGLMANTAIATGGKTTGRDFQQFTAMSKGTSTFLTPEAYAGLVSSIGGELGAGKTGNALAMSTRAAIGGTMTKKGREQLEGLGLWDRKSKSLVRSDDFQADPHAWVEKNLIPVLKANGMLQMDKDGNVDPEKSKEVGKLFAKMFSNSNVASFFTLLTTQGRRYEKDQALRNKVAVDNFAAQQKSPTYAMGAMTTAFKDMLGTMSEADMPELIAGLNGLTKAFNGIAGMDPKSLGLLTEIGGAFLALGPSIWAARLAYMTFITPLRELPALLRVSTAAIRAIAASEYAASAATMAWNGSALVLSTTLGRLLATLTAVTAGFEAGSWLSKQADKIDAQAEDQGASPRAMQAETMARQRDLAKQNQLWNTPGTGWWKHFQAGQAAADDRRFLDARGQPYGEPSLSGKRARGGPVASGSTYLVGENGPELFTAGKSGGITSNADLNRLASSDEGSGRVIALAVRYQTFALASAIDALGKREERMRRATYASSGEGGNGGYGSGTLSGSGGARISDEGDHSTAGYGRQALARRIRGAGSDPNYQSPGPHVRLGKMGAGGKGRYAKFDAKAPAIMGALMTKYGLTKEQAAGVVGNLGHESARFTAYHEGGKVGAKGGVGWAQWTGPRRRAFERWTAAHGLNPTSDEASWRYLTEGDPETAAAIAAVKRTNTAHDAVRAFHDSFERSADISHGRIVKPGNWNSRLDLADRAERTNPVAGIADPSKAPAPHVPEVIASRAKRDGEFRQKMEHERSQNRDAGTTHVHVGGITVNAQPHHDEERIAEMVHRKFCDSSRHQYNDGVFG